MMMFKTPGLSRGDAPDDSLTIPAPGQRPSIERPPGGPREIVTHSEIPETTRTEQDSAGTAPCELL